MGLLDEAAIETIECGTKTPAGEAVMNIFAEEVCGGLRWLSMKPQPAQTAADSAIRKIIDDPIINESSASWSRRFKDALVNQRSEYLTNLQGGLNNGARLLAGHVPAVRDIVRGSQLNVLEIGPRLDTSIPKLCDHRLEQYIGIDIDPNPMLYEKWKESLTNNGLSANNKFYICGHSARLPIRSNSQDIVFAQCSPAFVFTNSQPLAVHYWSLSEAARVLKPGGKLIVRPYTAEIEAVGQSLLSQHFTKALIHTPSPQDLQEIFNTRVGNPQIISNAADLYSTLVAIK